MPSKILRTVTTFTCFMTLFLIFVGGMVTSTGSGLAVPDWPLSYGTLFPPMIGGVFYEHGHRMVASFVGLMMLSLVVMLKLWEPRRWVRILGYVCCWVVACQGVLGGITVKFMLPTPVSVLHGVLAQTFFILTIILAYSQSRERFAREQEKEIGSAHPRVLGSLLVLIIFIYLQLIIGAIMRHTGSGLAIPDFPRMGGEWFPTFNHKMMTFINLWRFDHDFDPVSKIQVIVHFFHRLGAAIIFFAVCVLNLATLKYYKNDKRIKGMILFLNSLIAAQIILGVATLLTLKNPVITSVHVATGAAALGAAVWMFLRTAPLSLVDLEKSLHRC